VSLSFPAHAWCCAFHANVILLRSDFTLPPCAYFAKTLCHAQHDLGTWRGAACYALDCADNLPPDLMVMPMRDYMRVAPAEEFARAARAFQVIEWERNHRFCGRCGTSTENLPGQYCKACPVCMLRHYPRLSPVVIMSVVRDNEILLSRSPHFRPGMYSVQAGFVEVGETLEQAVMREIAEETALQVKNLRYFGSQSWPFPHSLMLAFTTLYAGGELRIDGLELEDARWCCAHEVPAILPPPLSIAYQLIAYFLKNRN
jgi:NAD+ diphosphatase